MTPRLFAAFLAGTVACHAQEEPSPAAAESPVPASVQALGPPQNREFPGGIRVAVSAATHEAQEHVIQGLNHLHGGWEFEASRHFAAAIAEDPDCLLAHWGMVMTLLSPSPETLLARKAATERLLDLIDAGQGTDLERGYAYGLVKYLEGGPPAAAIAFDKVARQYPNDLQAPIFHAMFGRTGYDPFTGALPDQQAAEKSLEERIAKHPDSPVPLHALLVIRAEAPNLAESLPLAIGLAEKDPDYPPYRHLLGHYQWRCGKFSEAAESFAKAVELYGAWMRQSGAGIADCPEWVKAQTYRAVALACAGDFTAAQKVSEELSLVALPKDRNASPGMRLLQWEAATLSARLLLYQGASGAAAKALATLPGAEALKSRRTESLAYWWIDGLRLALQAMEHIDQGRLDAALETADKLTAHGEAMAKYQGAATAGGERSAWNRSFYALETLASEVRGRLALAGPAGGRGSAYNWFLSAKDRQRPPTQLNPPVILTPMAARVGDYLAATGKPQEAVEAYEEALRRQPGDAFVLKALDAAKRAGGGAKTE